MHSTLNHIVKQRLECSNLVTILIINRAGLKLPHKKCQTLGRLIPCAKMDRSGTIPILQNPVCSSIQQHFHTSRISLCAQKEYEQISSRVDQIGITGQNFKITILKKYLLRKQQKVYSPYLLRKQQEVYSPYLLRKQQKVYSPYLLRKQQKVYSPYLLRKQQKVYSPYLLRKQQKVYSPYLLRKQQKVYSPYLLRKQQKVYSFTNLNSFGTADTYVHQYGKI